MSRLTDLIAQAKAKDAAFGQELEREFNVLSSRRSFGLNFERHRPESVELPGRPVRKGDKVHVLPPRGSTAKGDQRPWKVTGFQASPGGRIAKLELLYSTEGERQTVAVADLIVVAEFKDYIYPGLVSTGKVERGDGKPFHTVINGENFHVLEALNFTHQGKIDAIYIDPPYNTGAKDWKYNNDYVEGDDLYRHSKWLAMMERRLIVARALLNPISSALIVTIDEREYLRLGLLLEQIFTDARIQMVTSVIKPGGVSRDGLFARSSEFVFYVFFGEMSPEAMPLGEAWGGQKEKNQKDVLYWNTLWRSGSEPLRTDRPDSFFPIYVSNETGKIVKVGEPLPLQANRSDVATVDGAVTVWPIRSDGVEGRWQLGKAAIQTSVESGFVKVGKLAGENTRVYYLARGEKKRITDGTIKVVGTRSDGSVIGQFVGSGRDFVPTDSWALQSHDATRHGSNLLKTILPNRSFPFPKSLYAVEDCLRFLIGKNRDAVVLDFFSGSGTTAHAVMRMNKQDGGRRQCISVTNNEVGVDEQARLRNDGLRAGDPDWEQWGICEYITKPRIGSAITGMTPDGDQIRGDYKFTDEFPVAEGFAENVEFFTLTYETPITVRHNRAFGRIAPLLWMRAGSDGRRIDELPDQGWEIADSYGLLIDLDKSAAFAKAIEGNAAIRVVYVVTDDDRRFQSVVRQLPGSVEPVRLYESYLTNFRFAMGR
ncbi:site-specific DNA-methyltransferase [Sphingomonas sp. Leaf198]|uniref:site-specific DNA-methyltransferase n=1 Tax=Sphingomonas sp. Leaf198 TaxID=1736299 RepID=UPI0006FDF897|nr:DNA methyltransferase [Sphingomonas sp. Leaf198]KQS49731.1 DNA methyltransferase [Sphingomonas sp. Leaf198]